MKINVRRLSDGSIISAESGSERDESLRRLGYTVIKTEELTLPPPPPKMVRKETRVDSMSVPAPNGRTTVYIRGTVPITATNITLSWDEPEETK